MRKMVETTGPLLRFYVSLPGSVCSGSWTSNSGVRKPPEHISAEDPFAIACGTQRGGRASGDLWGLKELEVDQQRSTPSLEMHALIQSKNLGSGSCQSLLGWPDFPRFWRGDVLDCLDGPGRRSPASLNIIDANNLHSLGAARSVLRGLEGWTTRCVPPNRLSLCSLATSDPEPVSNLANWG